MTFNGLGLHLGNLSLLSTAQTRSISGENQAGGKGQGGRIEVAPHEAAWELGSGWKTRPAIRVEQGQTLELAHIDGPGAIQQIWMTPLGNYRFAILRCHWDGEENPSVEVPIGDFFASAYTSYATYRQISSLPVCVNPGNAFNCYWEMPFRKSCRITIKNIGLEPLVIFYQINYVLTAVPEEAAYFHAQFRRAEPLLGMGLHTIIDGVQGVGHYVGTYIAWQVNGRGRWGDAEVRFYLDGDLPGGLVGQDVAECGGGRHPTICGSGTQDYFCGSSDSGGDETRQCQEYTTAYAGMPHVIRPDGADQANPRFSLYRWHIMDPVRFQRDLAVTIQTPGRRTAQRFVSHQDDISSVAFWYQREPHAPFPTLPGRDRLAID